MATLDDSFREPAEPLALHPRLRDWQRRLEQPGATAQLELYCPATALGITQTEIYLHFTEQGKPQPLETVAWDDDLNAGLITLGVRSIDTAHEAARFTFGLRSALREAEREFGDGYLNGVLLDLIRESDLTRYPKIAEVLEHAYALSPERTGKAARRYNLCRDMVAYAISGRMRELTRSLKYSQDEAKEILTAALAQYLDDRFSVTRRRQFGLL